MGLPLQARGGFRSGVVVLPDLWPHDQGLRAGLEQGGDWGSPRCVSAAQFAALRNALFGQNGEQRKGKL